MKFDEIVNVVLEKCWKGYTQKGMKKKGKKMVLDNGTMLAIIIALAGSCFVMVVGIRAQGQLHRVINKKNEKIRFLEGEISRLRRSKVESR